VCGHGSAPFVEIFAESPRGFDTLDEKQEITVVANKIGGAKLTIITGDRVVEKERV
jgi:hypothetical protein